jgi:hypothetical protein
MNLQSNGYNDIKNIKHQKTNGEDQNGKRHKSYGTKLRHFKVRGPK